MAKKAPASVPMLVNKDAADFSMPVHQGDVDALKSRRKLFEEFVHSQLKREIDYGVIPGTDKPSLFKPGAEKFLRLFNLGVRVERTLMDLDRVGNYVLVAYRAEVYLLGRPDIILAQCEGSCNSQEKKYKDRKVYEWVQGKKELIRTEETPVCDVLNTLMKMSQKRAVVGAVILAVGASDFFSQDIDDGSDADANGVNPGRQKEKPRAVIPKALNTKSQSQHETAPTSGPVVRPNPAPAPGWDEGLGTAVTTPAAPARRWKDNNAVVAAILNLGMTKGKKYHETTAFAREVLNKPPTEATYEELERVYHELEGSGK